MYDGIDPEVPPGGTGCKECLEGGGWWVHLRRCALCGHIGCCDTSPGRHATAHYRETGHAVMRTFEPGERWFFDYRTQRTFIGPELMPPSAHPASQPVPGPDGRVPADWQAHLHT